MNVFFIQVLAIASFLVFILLFYFYLCRVLCSLCVVVIILNFMCYIGLCSKCSSYWVAHSGAFVLWEIPVASHLLYTVYVFAFVYCVCVTNKLIFIFLNFDHTNCTTSRDHDVMFQWPITSLHV